MRRSAIAPMCAALLALALAGQSAHAAGRGFTATGGVQKVSAPARSLLVTDTGGDKALQGRAQTIFVPGTARVTLDRAPASFGALAYGDMVTASGSRDSRGRLVATSVSATSPPQPDAGGVPAGTPDTSTGPLAITIQDFTFVAPAAVVPVGTFVTVTNKDGFAHTFSGNHFSSGSLGTGAGYTVMFTVPGTYRFFCAIHPFMNGTLEVTP